MEREMEAQINIRLWIEFYYKLKQYQTRNQKAYKRTQKMA